MEKALAVVEGTDGAKDLVREAGELAAGVDASLVLVHVTTEDEYKETRESLEQIPDMSTSYSMNRAREGARQFAEDLGREVLDGVDVDVETVGRLGNKRKEILATAHEYGCDHVFLAGRKRSPTGKAVFGDVTQDVILEFDGAVTVITE